MSVLAHRLLIPRGTEMDASNMTGLAKVNCDQTA
jgi:hypothetical protein